MSNKNKRTNGTSTTKATNTKQMRIDTMKQTGINTDNMFSINMSNIPVGTPVKVNIGGIEYDLSSNGVAQAILNNGYVFNRRTDGRFTTAETFRMLNWKPNKWQTVTGKNKEGWDACLRTEYGYMYQFDMMKDELHKLNKMRQQNDPELVRLEVFFTPEVVVKTCEDYMKKLRKYIEENLCGGNDKDFKFKKCKGKPYITVKFCKGGSTHVFVKDIQFKIYNPLYYNLNVMKAKVANLNHELINKKLALENFEKTYRDFMKYMVVLPYETNKCSAWKDAFKAKGAYVTLLNIIKFHGVTFKGTNTVWSVKTVEDLLKVYTEKNELWRFHILLKDLIKGTDFDLQNSPYYKEKCKRYSY